MARLEYFIVCESISIDQETNRVSLFNVVEELHFARPGSDMLSVSQLVAVSCWNREPGDENLEFQATLRIHDPGGASRDFTMNFRMDRPRQRLIQRLQGIPATAHGDLRIEVMLNGDHKAEHVVTIHPMVEMD